MGAFREQANRCKPRKLIVNKGRIGSDRGRSRPIRKLTEVKMYPVYLMRYSCIILVWFGSRFLRTKQVTRGSPGIGLLIQFCASRMCNSLVKM